MYFLIVMHVFLSLRNYYVCSHRFQRMVRLLHRSLRPDSVVLLWRRLRRDSDCADDAVDDELGVLLALLPAVCALHQKLSRGVPESGKDEGMVFESRNGPLRRQTTLNVFPILTHAFIMYMNQFYYHLCSRYKRVGMNVFFLRANIIWDWDLQLNWFACKAFQNWNSNKLIVLPLRIFHSFFPTLWMSFPADES